MGIWERSIKYAASNIIIHLGVIYSVYDKWKKFVWENLAGVWELRLTMSILTIQGS